MYLLRTSFLPILAFADIEQQFRCRVEYLSLEKSSVLDTGQLKVKAPFSHSLYELDTIMLFSFCGIKI